MALPSLPPRSMTAAAQLNARFMAFRSHPGPPPAPLPLDDDASNAHDDLFASPIWASSGPAFEGPLVGNSSSSSSESKPPPLAPASSSRGRPDSPDRRRLRRPPPSDQTAVAVEQWSAAPLVSVQGESHPLMPSPPLRRPSHISQQQQQPTDAPLTPAPRAGAVPPPPLLTLQPPFPSLSPSHRHPPPPASLPPAPLPPPPPPLPDELDPWTQQEAYDRRSAALARASTFAPSSSPRTSVAPPPSSSAAAAAVATFPSVDDRFPVAAAAAASDGFEDEDERQFEEAIRLSLADVTLEGGWRERPGRAGDERSEEGRRRSGRGGRNGLEERPQAAYNHTPPPQDSKPLSEQPSPVSARPPPAQSFPPDCNAKPSSSSSPPSSTAAGPSSFALELQAHTKILEQLRQWQAGLLPSSLEWHELVPSSVRLSLDPQTAERQGLLWEIFRSEMDYVRNLEAGLNGFFTPLLYHARPHEIGLNSAEGRQAFIRETFFNLAEIFPRHSRMVYRLQERQIESHPVVSTIADVLIDSLIDLLGPYELYLKHYPYAEARLRKELASNRPFAAFIARLSESPTVRKQDLLSFLVSPLSRLSKLELALDRLRKITPADESAGDDGGGGDAGGLAVVLDQIRGMLRAVQPGVSAASSKVAAWQIGRALRFRRGERSDLGLALESDERALVRIGRVWRRQRTERDWHGWTDVCLVLFDNYLLLTREEAGGPGSEDDKVYAVVSRPIPLEFLAVVGSEHDPSEHRRDMIVDYARRSKPFRTGNGSLLDPLLQPEREIFPFHIEHVGLKKGYSLYVESEEGRRAWLGAIKEQTTVRKVVLENNALFSISPLTYSPPARVRPASFCRPPTISRSTDTGPSPGSPSPSLTPGGDGSSTPPPLRQHATSGSISSVRSMQSLAPPTEPAGSAGAAQSSVIIAAAASFERYDKEMFMVADSDGLSVGYRDDSRSHRRLIESSSITDLQLLPDADAVLILATSTLYALDLRTLLPTADPDGWPRIRKDSGLTVSAWGESVSGFRLGRREARPLVVYWCHNRLSGQSAIEVYEPLLPAPDPADRSPSIRSVSSFSHTPSSFGEGSGGGGSGGATGRSSGERRRSRSAVGYRHVGSGSAVGAVYDIIFYGAVVAIAIDKGFIVSDPLHLTTSTPNVPTFVDSAQLKPVYSTLKARVTSFQPLLMHWLDDETAICVFETGCCWVDRRGAVAKSGAYITWETRATAAVVRGRALILFAKDRRYVTVHDVCFGSLRQATEGRFRLVGSGKGNVLAVQGENQLVELLETVALPMTFPDVPGQGVHAI